jgi:hypothetical protein
MEGVPNWKHNSENQHTFTDFPKTVGPSVLTDRNAVGPMISKYISDRMSFNHTVPIPVNCNALKTLHVRENVMNFTLVWSKYNIHSQNTKAICTTCLNHRQSI